MLSISISTEFINNQKVLWIFQKELCSEVICFAISFLMATAKLATAAPTPPPGIVKDRIFASSLAAKMVASELCQVRDFPICVKISLIYILF